MQAAMSRLQETGQHVSTRYSPEICCTKNWLRGVEHPPPSGCTLRVIGSKCEGDMFLETPQDNGNQNPVAPGARISHINVVSSTLLHLQRLLRAFRDLCRGILNCSLVQASISTSLEIAAKKNCTAGQEVQRRNTPQVMRQLDLL